MSDTKTRAILMRIAPADLAKIQEAAKRDRRTVSDFARNAAISAAERMVETAGAERRAS